MCPLSNKNESTLVACDDSGVIKLWTHGVPSLPVNNSSRLIVHNCDFVVSYKMASSSCGLLLLALHSFKNASSVSAQMVSINSRNYH